MKKNLLNLIIPLTLLSFFTLDKWWYGIPVDGPDTMLYGFPFIYRAEGWHTSMAIQFFVKELVINLLVFFTFWSVLIFILKKFIIKKAILGKIGMVLWIIAVINLVPALFIASNKNNLFHAERHFEFEQLDSGYKLFWQSIDRPDYYRYKSKQN